MILSIRIISHIDFKIVYYIQLIWPLFFNLKYFIYIFEYSHSAEV